jgi:hypothetical protein
VRVGCGEKGFESKQGINVCDPPLLGMYPLAPAHMAVYPAVDRITPIVSVVLGPCATRRKMPSAVINTA